MQDEEVLKQLGQKLRQQRLAMGMTQKDLAGDDLTRNMLSRMENGAVLPSLPTLLTIAKKLKTPVGYFLQEQSSLFFLKKEQVILSMKTQFAKGNHKEVLRLWRLHLQGETDDEVALLLAESCLLLAGSALYEGAFTSAASFVRDAQDFAAKTIYPTSHIKACAELLRAVSTNVQSPKYELKQEDYLQFCNDAVNTDLYCYLTEQTEGHTFTDPLLAEHLEARAMMKQGRYRDALLALEQMEERKAQPGFSPFLLFWIYTDLEACQKELRDFEAAYRYASKRISLLSAFRS